MAKKKDIKEMPINVSERLAAETLGAREEPDLQSDTFSSEEQKEIYKRVIADVETGYNSQSEWLEVKKKELQHVHSEKPSIIEGLKKRTWMSDRNLGLCAGILDIYQATLLATSYNPNTIHFIAEEINDIDNRDNLSRFAKWGLGQSEANFQPECDDWLANKVAHGFSCFKVYWEVKYKWVEKRIPQYSKNKKNVVIGYEKETEQRRFERGVIENIDNIDDILMPSYGKDIQELPFFIEVVHHTFNDLRNMDDMGIIENFDEEKFLALFRSGLNGMSADDIRHKKLDIMKFKEVDNDSLSNAVLDLYLWHGEYEKDGKRERYQFLVEPVSEMVFFGKPVRKLNRTGKLPYVAGPLRRVPGMLRGGSLIMLISNLINALNNNYNQTSDFQYVENMPFGFANISELGGRKGIFEMEPGIIFNVDDEDVKNKIFFPNISRSLAWSYQDKEFLMQMIEKLTGAASYFLTTDSDKGTATRDMIVDEKSDTKFGLWVKRVMLEICEAINMWIELYQDNAPVGLGERVLGKDGEKLFNNLSIDDLRGRYHPQMVPDITHGSKAYEQKIAMWAFTALQQGSIWLNPEVNPRGNWKITEEAMRKMGYDDPEEYLPPMPKAPLGSGKDIESEFLKLKQGDILNPPPEGVTPAVMEHYAGHRQQKEEKYNEIPEEYRPNFDSHLFATYMNMLAFVRQKQQEAMVNKISQNAIGRIERAATPPQQNVPPAGGVPPQGGPGQQDAGSSIPAPADQGKSGGPLSEGDIAI